MDFDRLVFEIKWRREIARNRGQRLGGWNVGATLFSLALFAAALGFFVVSWEIGQERTAALALAMRDIGAIQRKSGNFTLALEANPIDHSDFTLGNGLMVVLRLMPRPGVPNAVIASHRFRARLAAPAFEIGTTDQEEVSGTEVLRDADPHHPGRHSTWTWELVPKQSGDLIIQAEVYEETGGARRNLIRKRGLGRSITVRDRLDTEAVTRFIGIIAAISGVFNILRALLKREGKGAVGRLVLP